MGNPEQPAMVIQKTGEDVTARMQNYASRKLKELEKEELCGFIFKSGSPSNGMERVKVWNEKGQAVKSGVGIFARAFMDHFPLIPVEEEGRLHDARIRENFIERIFTLQRFRKARQKGLKPANLMNFHADHKLLLMSHSVEILREMGRLTANPQKHDPDPVWSTYEQLLLKNLSLKTTVKKNVNVLQHILGYFKKYLSADEKQEGLEIIQQYHQNWVPLIVPLTLLGHFVRKYQPEYLLRQVYLRPHPLELKLRNHV